MSRKAISEETLTYLIIAVVGLIIMAWATTSIADTIKSTTDKEACRASVELKAQTILKIPVGGNVPLKCKSQELKITDKNQEKMKETIANAMYDCWYQYGEGKIDFIKLFSNTAVECYIC
ncbi:MAG: hypothetical protein KJ623_03565, partial [Nanoarchaeota archaeon]|nr:hypothetical protein [Nanoarchaeota archaeon]